MGRARTSRRSGIVQELRRRADWLREHMGEATGPTGHAMRAELDAMERAAAIVGAATLPVVHPVPADDLTPAQRDEWRQLAAWEPERQVRMLVDVLARLAREGLSVEVAEAISGAHHAERVAPARA